MATYTDIALLDAKQASLVKLAPSVYADMVKVWFNNGASSSSKVPHDLELFNKLNSGQLEKPTTNEQWENLAPAFPTFSTFSLFMLLHRRKEGRDWATFQDSFALLHHLITPGNYRTNIRWTDVSSRSGILGPGTKAGPPYTGNDLLISKFAQFMQVGKVGNTLFSSSKLLLGGGKSTSEPLRIHNLIPGYMLQWLDYIELGLPEVSDKTSDAVKRQFYDVCTSVVEGELNPLKYLKSSYSGPATAPKAKREAHGYKVDLSNLPDL